MTADLPASAALRRPIAVIGAGFSGTMAALHLMRRLPSEQPVILCERARAFGRGLAYSTGDADHLLNVRAANMSALHDDPEHFQDWLDGEAGSEAGQHPTEAGLFASRGLYGRYLRSMLEEAMRDSAAHAQLRLLPDEVFDVEPDPGGYTLVCATGRRFAVSAIVLAVGNLPVPEAADERWCRNPWSARTLRPLRNDLPVLIVGTGLTMVDLVTALRRQGGAAPIVAISRGGMMPRVHQLSRPWPTPRIEPAEAASITSLLRRVRAELRQAAAEGVDWRGVIDSLRPITSTLWLGLPAAERARFLRHARRWWDTARHRMAPPNGAAIARLIETGALRVRAARLLGHSADDRGITVRLRPRGAGAEETLRVQRVISAVGPEALARSEDVLVRRMLQRSVLALDDHGLGVAVDGTLRSTCADAAGEPHRIWALGPVVRGVFWECTAVPDIRGQAAQVADSVALALREQAPRWSFMI